LQSFTWAVRSEPGVINVFEKIFGTEDLLVSFDAVNVSLANRKDLPPNKPWAHQDQGVSLRRCPSCFVQALTLHDHLRQIPNARVSVVSKDSSIYYLVETMMVGSLSSRPVTGSARNITTSFATKNEDFGGQMRWGSWRSDETNSKA
jgi:hypothetical protein